MNITDLSGKTVFLEDLADITIAGSISEPTEIAFGSVSFTNASVRREIFDEMFYASFDGLIHVNLQDIVSQRRDLILPDEQHPVSSDIRDCGRFYLTVGDVDSYTFYVNIFSKVSQTRLSDIDYLPVPDKGGLYLSVYAGLAPYSLYLQSGGILMPLYQRESPVSGPARGVDSYYFDTAALNVGRAPFRFVVRSDTDETPVKLSSCAYQCFAGDFQEFVFLSRLGGCTYFPMRGALEFVPEFEFGNGRYSVANARISCKYVSSLRQNTGGLSPKAMAALSELMKSGVIRHKVGGEWRDIVIESADLHVYLNDGLNFGSFTFRYAEDLPASEYFQAGNCPLNTGDSEANLSAENLELNNPETFTEDAATAAMEDVQEQTDNEL